MSVKSASIRAIVFDYGNTLIPYGPEALGYCNTCLAQALEAEYGAMEQSVFEGLCQRARMMPYEGAPPLYHETDWRCFLQEMIHTLYQKEVSEPALEALLEVRRKAFIDSVCVTDSEVLVDILQRLSARYAVGLVSNYPDGAAIRSSMQQLGIADFFSSVVVSGDLGYVKPHPLPFAQSLCELGLAAHEVLFVGDNWLADVQGAKRVGMQVVHIQRWTPPELFEPQPDDLQPDATLGHLNELLPLLSLDSTGYAL